MELTKTPEGTVTRMALVRAIRGITYNKLAAQVQVDATDIFSWERGQVFPGAANLKRMGLAMRWNWQDFTLEPLPYDEAWEHLVGARKANVTLQRGAAEQG